MKAKLLAVAAVSAVLVSGPAAHAEQFINVLTGGTSGVYYPLGVAIGKIFTAKIPDAKTQVQATKASVENLNLLKPLRPLNCGTISLTLPGRAPTRAFNSIVR